MISFIIPFRSNEPERIRSFAYVHEELAKAFPEDEIVVADWPLDDGLGWSRAKARNRGAVYASEDILAFIDADSWVPDDLLVRAEASIGLSSWIFPYDTYYALSEEGTERALQLGPRWMDLALESDYIFPGPDPIDRPPSVGGCVIVSRSAFEEVQGYDERFVGWGFEDRAFALALETLCGPEKRIPGPLCHFWHPEPEEQRFGQPYLEHNRALYQRYLAASGRPEMMRALVGEH